MAVYIRRFLFDPGSEVLLNIESVNILDLEPPSEIQGIGSGTVLCVGEFDDGPYATVQEVAGANDFVNTWGVLGYTLGGTPSFYPCAVSRSADGAITPETWNGNGFVQLTGKQFSRLLLSRVDTSVGAVNFTRLASVTGGAQFRYLLAAAQVLQLTLNGLTTTSATFNATAATVTASGGTFPSTFVGGETLTLGYDSVPNFTVTFLSADQTNAQVVARINQYAGFTFADLSGGQIRLTGTQKGTGGQVRIVSGSTGVIAQLGMTVATTSGTGNVQNIAAVSSQEITVIVQAAIANTKVEVTGSGNLRVSNTGGGSILVGAGTTATGLGFANGDFATATSTAGIITSSAGTYNTTFAGGETLTLGFDDQPDFIVTFQSGDQTLAQVITRINTYVAAYGFTMASTPSANILQLTGKNVGSQGQIRVVAASAGGVLTTLGLTVKTVSGFSALAGSIPAGTVVTDANAVHTFVTTQTTAVSDTNAGPYTLRVRHAIDDGSGTSASAGSVTTIATPPDLGAFSCINPQIITAALSETAIDAAYVTAIGKTVDVNSIAKQTNIMFSARQSNAVRRALKTNAIQASANGCFGRVACIRPPLNSTRVTVTSTTAEPGVGAYRDQRVIYCHIEANVFVPQIATRGTTGGTGFTASGNVDVGPDGWMACILSQLPPEENPGQDTPFTSAINGIGLGANIQNLTMADYIAFKASGIAALRVEDGVAAFQSGVTSVDPLVHQSLKNIARRRMADFIQDSIALASKKFGKKLGTLARRNALASEITTFMDGLLKAERIGGYTVDPKSGNTPALLAQGLYRIIVKGKTLPSLDAIVLATTIGEGVTTVVELPANAA